jgi:hypothetical protein
MLIIIFFNRCMVPLSANGKKALSRGSTLRGRRNYRYSVSNFPNEKTAGKRYKSRATHKNTQHSCELSFAIFTVIAMTTELRWVRPR